MSDIEPKTTERPIFGALHHVSLPCRDVKEAISFYCELLGGNLIHEQWGFFLVSLGGTYLGISSEGTSWTEPDNEYASTVNELWSRVLNPKMPSRSLLFPPIAYRPSQSIIRWLEKISDILERQKNV